MKTNKIGLLSLALTGALAMAVSISCEKENAELNKKAVVEIRLSEINSELNSFFSTKASGDKHNNQAYDTLKNTLQLYIFNDFKQLQEYRCLTGEEISNQSSLQIEVPSGTKHIWAIANSHDVANLKKITTSDDFAKKTAKLEKEDVGDFTMVGKLENFKVSYDSGQPAVANLTMKRMVSRVHIGTIKTAFTGGYEDSLLTNVKVYLINYYAQAHYSTMTGKRGTVYNEDCLQTHDADDMTMANIDRYTVGNVGTTPVNVDQYFYMYGNDLPDGLPTRLIIEGNLGVHTYYYPIAVHDANSNILSANTSLNITDVTITKPGAQSPNDDLENGTLQFSMATENWIARDTTGIVF